MNVGTDALPFKPEPLGWMQSRARLALDKVWTFRNPEEEPPGDRPGLHRTHVFDFDMSVISEDPPTSAGARIILSVEWHIGRGFTCLHCSASFTTRPHSAYVLARNLLALLLGSDLLDRLVLRRQFVSEGGVLHVVYDWPPRSIT